MSEETILTETSIDLDLLIDQVRPDNSVMMKDSGVWCFYINEDDFDKGYVFECQSCYESFDEFVRRVCIRLVNEEKPHSETKGGMEFYLTNTDYAIAQVAHNERHKNDKSNQPDAAQKELRKNG